MIKSMLTRLAIRCAAFGTVALLVGCTGAKTTIESTVASDFDGPLAEVFIASEEEERSYLQPSVLNQRLGAKFEENGIESEEQTFDPLSLDTAPGLKGARENDFPFALVLVFEGGTLGEQTYTGVNPSVVDIDVSLYDVETERRVWRAVLNAVESDQMEAMVTNLIFERLRADGVISEGESPDAEADDS